LKDFLLSSKTKIQLVAFKVKPQTHT